MSSNLQDLLKTSGFPRSGNTFLNYSFYKLFNLERLNLNNHSVAAIEHRPHTFVPFRDPLDCISSWHLYQEEFTFDERILENDLKFYFRFHTSVEKLSHKVTLLDFDMFKNNLDYIVDTTTSIYPLMPSNVSLEDIKTAMKEDNKEINLPRNTELQKSQIKERIIETALYQDCVFVYETLKTSVLKGSTTLSP